MLFKLIALILTAGATACALLVFRQERIDLAHETAAIHMRLGQHEKSEWRMRMLLNESVRVQQVAILAERFAREHNLTMVPFASASFDEKAIVIPDASESPGQTIPEIPPGEDTQPAEPTISPVSNPQRTGTLSGREP